MVGQSNIYKARVGFSLQKCDGAKPKCCICQKSPNGLECIYQPGKKRKKKSDLLQGTSLSENQAIPPTKITFSSSSGSADGETVEIISPQAARPIIAIDIHPDPSWSFYDETVRSNSPSSGPNTNTLVPSAFHKMTPQMQLEHGPKIMYAATQRVFDQPFGTFNTSGPVYTIDADPQAFALSNVSIHDRKMLL